MNTILLYLEDSYKKSCKSQVVSVVAKNGKTAIILDQTVFYPIGGGQPSDQGVIKGNNGVLKVNEVRLIGTEVHHTGKLVGQIKAGEQVECTINWERRYKNMRIHTGGHVVHEAVKELYPELTPIEAEHGKKSYVKYKGTLPSEAEESILNKSNDIVSEELDINTEFVSLNELKKRVPWVPEHLPKNKPLRIIQIGSYPPIPDGGTQLDNTSSVSEITEIKIINDKDGVEVHYKVKEVPALKGIKLEPNKDLKSESINREEIITLKNTSIARISQIADPPEIEKFRIELFGKSGEITNLIKKLKNLNPEDKKTLGPLINETKKTLEQIIDDKKNENKPAKDEWFDPTIPVETPKIGKLHPTSIVISEMVEIFKHMGFSVYEGPEIESDKYNYELLNLPKDHPARSLQDVLYIKEPEILLRSHTSSVESRALEKLKPPFRIVVPGKCYRYENVNSSNNIMFYQFQGVALQKGISMADLKGTLLSFVSSYFGEKRKTRFRCKFYPEVEPGVGLDIDCPFCKQKGCAVCKGRGWLELVGSGIIHPNILKNFGYNPKEISGFAFGMGLDRIIMDRFNITDIRSLYNGDIKYTF